MAIFQKACRFHVALIGVLLACVNLGSGATTYVAITGSDSNPGTSASPFRTITFAYSKANPGDVVIVRPGVYTDFYPNYGIHLNRGGSAAAPLTLRSELRGAAVIDGQNLSSRPQGVNISTGYHIIVFALSPQ
jgi:hypothetical protein